jgi:hypothetical protein
MPPGDDDTAAIVARTERVGLIDEQAPVGIEPVAWLDRDELDGAREESSGAAAQRWVDALCRDDLGRVFQLTAPLARWRDPSRSTADGRAAVMARLAAERDGILKRSTRTICVSSHSVATMALLRYARRTPDGLRHFLQTLFLRVDGNQVAEIWTAPAVEVVFAGCVREWEAAAGDPVQ